LITALGIVVIANRPGDAPGSCQEFCAGAVPDYVWTSYLKNREAPAAYWRILCVDHYLQVDEPGLIADILRATLAEDPPPAEIEGQNCRAVQTQANQ
jgi:hypothetical protein